MPKTASHGLLSPNFKTIRVLFCYTDNSSDLCAVNNKCLKNAQWTRFK